MTRSAGPAAAIRARAGGLFPGGVNSPVRAGSPVLARGEGARVWDADGREYVDLVGAYGPLILGHAAPAVVRAITEAIALGGPFGATTEAEVELGERIRRRMPHVERVRFVSSGTEAAMSALRVARAATGRDAIVKFEGGYHGHADSLLAAAGSGAARLSIPGSAGVTAAAAGQTLIARYNDLDSVERLLEGGRVAAVIVEPVAANMGVVLPGPGFLEGLRRATRAAGCLLIFDEVITGFRVAPGGAAERFAVRPDLAVLGKIIGGGLPVGAYGGRADLMDRVAPAGPVYQAGTLAGHPAVMAAGAATLDALDGATYARLDRLAARLEDGMRELGWAVARCGSILTPFASATPPRDFETARACDGDRYAALFERLAGAGVNVPPSQYEAWFLSAAHTDADVDRILAGAA